MILKLKGFQIRPMNRKAPIENTAKNFSLAYINLKTKVVTIDLFTPKRRENKSINTILRILAHELAHYKKMPYMQRFKGRIIVRQHYPAFYKQVNKNIEKFRKDKELGQYFGEKKEKKEESFVSSILRHLK